MKSSEVIQVLRSSIAATKAAGIEQVSIADLEAYADRLEQTAAETPEDVAAGEAAMESYRAELSAWISARQQQHEVNLEMLRAVITLGQSALKSALLINGGAAVALLAFIGGIWSSDGSTETITALASALIQYVFGVLIAAIAFGATYISQAGYGGEFGSASKAIGCIGHGIAVLGVIIAYVLFGSGSWSAFLAIAEAT